MLDRKFLILFNSFCERSSIMAKVFVFSLSSPAQFLVHSLCAGVKDKEKEWLAIRVASILEIAWPTIHWILDNYMRRQGHRRLPGRINCGSSNFSFLSSSFSAHILVFMEEPRGRKVHFVERKSCKCLIWASVWALAEWPPKTAQIQFHYSFSLHGPH